jgi:hypothetical protein
MAALYRSAAGASPRSRPFSTIDDGDPMDPRKSESRPQQPRGFATLGGGTADARSPRMNRLVLIAALAPAGGCFLTADHIVRTDAGEACALADSDDAFGLGPVTYAEGAPILFRVTVEGCLSSCEDSDLRASCEVQRTGNTLHVTSRGSYTHDEPFTPSVCTLDCNILAATCMTEPLEAGTYTVELGEQRTTITVPSTATEPACVTQEPR